MYYEYYRFYYRVKYSRGFSVVDLVEGETGDKFAMKRIQCHSADDERRAKKEAEFHRHFRHENLIGLEEWGDAARQGGCERGATSPAPV